MNSRIEVCFNLPLQKYFLKMHCSSNQIYQVFKKDDTINLSKDRLWVHNAHSQPFRLSLTTVNQ